MVITLPPPLEAALAEWAGQRGESPESLVVEVLQARLLPPFQPAMSPAEWKRRLAEAAVDCGVSLSDEALSSEGLYD